MPYIYPPQASVAAESAFKKGPKTSRRSMDSEYSVEYELDQHVPQDYPYYQGRYDDFTDSEDDFTMHTRQSRMSFNGRAYPPVPPDPSILPHPVEDWFDQPIEPIRTSGEAMIRQQEAAYPFNVAVEPMYSQRYQYPAAAQPGFAYDPAFHWSPSCAYPAAQPFAYRAPVLHPRHIQLTERPITPHDTYRYPDSHADHIYVANAVEAPTKEILNEALAGWYVDQLIELLVKPGSYRPGIGGQADDIWGPAGRDKDSWQRVGRSPPDYSKAWGRMGMTPVPSPLPRHIRARLIENEPCDPWNVIWSNKPIRSATLVAFVADMLQRMSISPVAVVSAVWYLQGLGLHEGDGNSGSELREFLRSQPWSDLEAVEKRLATLGLLLAGKWLDDNSFLSKSWSEVTSIPIKQIDRMERCALQDLHFSLYIPISSWSDHVNQLFTSLYHKESVDGSEAVVVTILDQMVTEARESELSDLKGFTFSTPAPDYAIDQRLSVEELPAAADQAINRDWSTFARPFSIDHHQAHDLDADMEAERTVAQLVDDEDLEEDEEDDEEFLDYDGAKRWLPPVSELRRSTSNSSAKSYQSVDAWRSSLPTVEPHVAHPSSSPSGMYYDSWRHQHDGRNSQYLTPTTAAKVYPTPPTEYVPKVSSMDVYLEPGISIVRPSEMKQFRHPSFTRKCHDLQYAWPLATRY